MSGLVNSQVYAGNVTGVATSTTVELGFEPSNVKVYNETTNMQYELTNGATNIQITTGSTGTITQSAAASGVSLSMLANGFKVVSNASDSINYTAIR